MAAEARLDFLFNARQKRLIEEAAAVEHRPVSAFVADAVLRRALEVVGRSSHPTLRLPSSTPRTSESVEVIVGQAGPAPRPIGGWTFELPDGWDAPLDDFAAWR